MTKRFSKNQIAIMREHYEGIKEMDNQDPNDLEYKEMVGIIKGSTPLMLRQLIKARIRWVSVLAKLHLEYSVLKNK
jgi:hypothetical protein